MLCLAAYLLNINNQLPTQIKDKIKSNCFTYKQSLIDQHYYLEQLKSKIRSISRSNLDYEVLLKVMTDNQFKEFVRSELMKR
ncbi:MAG: hypothetical protein BGO76_00055 [Caedibacter sp. 38-128]|nr:MAG: hypothetical protein BGO76_00055 [Caedibacter sp. 38-128]